MTKKSAVYKLPSQTLSVVPKYKNPPVKKIGWFSDTYVSNTFAVEEIKLIAVVLVVLAVIAVAYIIFRAYHNHLRTVVKNETAKAVVRQQV